MSLRTTVVTLGLLLAAAGCRAEDDGATWLSRMDRAMEQLQYRGVVVYAHDSQIEALRVSRLVGDNGAVEERVVALTGDQREVLRTPDDLHFRLPGGIAAQLRAPRGTATDPKSALTTAAGNYKVRVIGNDRVAGYEAVVVDAMPLDAARYSYRWWLEAKSGMLLGSMLIGANGEAIERLMFTSLELADGPAAAAAKSVPPAAAPDAPSWQAKALPRGFALVAMPSERAGLRHYLFSDGLANVSVYLEPTNPSVDPFTTTLRRGAVSISGRADRGVQITVIGDVPVATVQRIAAAVPAE